VGLTAEEVADGGMPVREGAAGDDDEAATAVVGPVVRVRVPVPMPVAGPVPVRAAVEEGRVDALLCEPGAGVVSAAVTEARKEQPATASSRRRPRILGARAVRDVQVVTLPR
jgi:hypothetical protein